ncbi:MAG: hypothetical protein QOF32_2580, partial [Gammaproteobacteria bacterium]|nr:hypothetical protein [Gammaproteobacteria bacterium]
MGEQREMRNEGSPALAFRPCQIIET